MEKVRGYIIRVALEDTHPPVWRRLFVPEKTDFLHLHRAIQIVFGWEDYHLHEFMTNDKEVSILSRGVEEYTDYFYYEDETPVDSFLKNYKWLRYTYDFGDDWQHRIELKKETEMEGGRFVRLLAFKGNNYAEDSHWSEDEEYRFPLDEESVAERLGEMEIPECDKQLLNEMPDPYDELSNEFKEWISDNEDAFAEMIEDVAWRAANAVQRVQNRPKRRSAIDKNVEDWDDFIDQMYLAYNLGDRVRSLLPAQSADMDEPQEYSVVLGCSELSSAQLLARASLKVCQDMNKYLGLYIPKNTRRDELAAKISRFLKDNPRYYCYIFDKAEMKRFLKWYQQMEKDGKDFAIPLPADHVYDSLQNTVIGLFELGLAELILDKTNDGETAHILLCSDHKEIFDGWKKLRIDKEYSTLQQLRKRTDALLCAYGMMDFPSYISMYHQHFHSNADGHELKRFVYWYGRMGQVYLTGINILSKENCFSGERTDFDTAALWRDKYAKEMDYKPYSQFSIKQMEKNYIWDMNPVWEDLFRYFQDRWEYETREAEEWVYDMVSTVGGRVSVPLVIEDTIESLEDEDDEIEAGILDFAELWLLVMRAAMTVPVPGLKGYSRTEYAEMTGELPDELCPVHLDATEELPYELATHIYQLPVHLQMELYQACNEEPKRQRDGLRTFLREHGENAEVLWLLFLTNAKLHNFQETKRILLHIKDVLPFEDDTVEGGLEELANVEEMIRRQQPAFFEDDYYDAPQPMIREEKKIYPNDPCPCGSGKKYKKCCGRKKS